MSLIPNLEQLANHSSDPNHDVFEVESHKLFAIDQAIIALGEISELQFNGVYFRPEVDEEERSSISQNLNEWRSLWRLLPQSLPDLSVKHVPLYFQGSIEVSGQTRYLLSRSVSSTQFIFIFASDQLSVERAKYYLDQSIELLDHKLQSASLTSNIG